MRPNFERSPPEASQWPAPRVDRRERMPMRGRTPMRWRDLLDERQLRGLLDHQDDVAAELRGEERRLDVLLVLVAVADDQRLFVLEHRHDGEQLGLGARLEAVVVRPAVLDQALDEVAVLVHLDRDRPRGSRPCSRTREMARPNASLSSTTRALMISEKRISSGRPMPRSRTSSTSSLRSMAGVPAPPGGRRCGRGRRPRSSCCPSPGCCRGRGSRREIQRRVRAAVGHLCGGSSCNPREGWIFLGSAVRLRETPGGHSGRANFNMFRRRVRPSRTGRAPRLAEKMNRCWDGRVSIRLHQLEAGAVSTPRGPARPTSGA